MAKWEPEAIQTLSLSVAKAKLNRQQAKKLEKEIDAWAGTVGLVKLKNIDAPSGDGYFEVVAENHSVMTVAYIST